MLLILLTVVFFVLRVIPGDPITALFEGRASPDVIAATRHALGLDKPYWEQYLIYLGQVFTGNLVTSLGEYYMNQRVLAVVLQRLQATVELTVGGVIVASFVGMTAVVCGGF